MATACYTEPYLPASFKGVGFKALDTSSEHGRRAAEGEFVFGERTAAADLGRKIRRFSINARFDTNDHVRQSNLLIDAVESIGPGLLVHPTRGVVNSTMCTSLRLRDNPENEQGVTYADLEFIEANDWVNGLALVGSTLGIIFMPLLDRVRESFLARYQPLRIPTFRQHSITRSAQNQIAAVAEKYATATVSFGNDRDRNRNLIDLRSIAYGDQSANDPTNVDRALVLGMAVLAQNTTGQNKFDIFRDLANGAALSSSFAEPAAAAENAIYNMVRTVCAIYMAQAATEITDNLSGSIFNQIDIIHAILAGEMTYVRGTCDNLLYLETDNFLTSVTTQLNARAYSSPGLIEFDFGGAVHPVQAAYEIYGDARRLREIEALNGVGRAGRVGPSVIGARVG